MIWTLLFNICAITGALFWFAFILFLLFVGYMSYKVYKYSKLEVRVGRCVRCSKCGSNHQLGVYHECVKESA